MVPGFHDPCLSILYFVVEWSLPSCPVMPLLPTVFHIHYQCLERGLKQLLQGLFPMPMVVLASVSSGNQRILHKIHLSTFHWCSPFFCSCCLCAWKMKDLILKILESLFQNWDHQHRILSHLILEFKDFLCQGLIIHLIL